MKPATAPMDQVLRAWPRLRGYFRGRNQVSEGELLNFFQEAVPIVTADAWPAVRQGLLRSQLLNEAGPGLLSFEPPTTGGFLKPVLLPEWLAVWQQLQAAMALPLGCLWSTRWLQPLLPVLPSLLVVEVRWAELNQAGRVLAVSSPSPDPVVVRAWQPLSPVRQVRGVPTARLEKMLVDAALIPELAPATSDAALAAALSVLLARQGFSQPVLLQYAARCGAEARWAALLHAATAPD
ncbi:hypothetical protein JAO73_19660 [Hymenobacter sp. BT523]|uniref:DUF6577 family protein n=1 Tax=Hymenobacter sp. BT523 TaxID=2795725 RepID=UPI0018EE410D|nr:DUF6577 family protein [Hymenobacter sp. BT523]MBJ6111248.1 hypothetical protein [Hymenobacter sp. BT523]